MAGRGTLTISPWTPSILPAWTVQIVWSVPPAAAYRCIRCGRVFPVPLDIAPDNIRAPVGCDVPAILCEHRIGCPA